MATETSKPAVELPRDESWHLDKRIGVTVIFTLIMNTIATIWFFAGLHYRLVALEDAEVSQMHTDVEVIKSQMQMVQSDMARLEVKLDRLLEAQE